MCLVVTGVSTLIHLYSVAYMDSDRGYARFFSYLNFFVFSMLLLVLAGNFVLLIVGWAFVGFASYALISFWYRRETATKAGMKAFVINVIGDIGLVLAAFFIFRELGTFDYLRGFDAARETFTVNEGVVIAICLLLCVGAFAKSAQLPLHTWLPDAMEGPTPVSALIHAATMVTAGVYLIARMFPFFELAPTAADIAAFVGLATLLVAATIALVVTDLKRIIAYSTMSQIGYMIVGVSIGAYAAGLFHLMTHAFFKALLFMAAGSVIARDGRQPEHRQDVAASARRCRSPRCCCSSARWRWRRSRAPPASSPRTRSSPSPPSAAACTGSSRSAATSAALHDRLLLVPDRLPGRRRASPATRRSELEQGHLAHGEPDEPGDRRGRGHRRRLPRPRAPHRRARAGRCGSAMARARRSARCSAG